jgi:hypothetical protein
MGADLIFQYFCLDENADMDKTKEKLLKAVDDVTIKEDREELINYYDVAYGQDMEENVEKIREEFKTIINELFSGIQRGWRDISSIRHKGDELWITGGMSWGDSPTESYGYFTKFTNLPQKVLKAGGVHW